MMGVGQPGVLRRYNCDIVESVIFERGPVTKPEIAQETSLSLPTVSKAVDELEKSGIVRVDETARGAGVGRRAKYYVTNEALGQIIVINHLDSRWYGTMIDCVGHVLEEKSLPICVGDLRESLAPLYTLIEGFQKNAENLLAMGIGIPGVILPDGNLGSIPTIPSWEGLPLQRMLERKYQVPVMVENDVNLMTLGYSVTNLPEARDVTFFYFGMGIGAGMILNDKLYKGFSGFAGEFGYMASYADTQSKSPVEGDLRALLQKIQKNPEDQTIRLAYYELIARVIINAVSMLNPQVVVIHGLGLEKGALPYFQQALSRHLPPTHQPEIRITENRNYGLNGLIHSCLEGLTKRCQRFEAENRG